MVVIKEKTHLRRTIQIEVQILTHHPADLRECCSRIVIEITHIVRNRQHIKVGIHIFRLVEDGETGDTTCQRTSCTHNLPTVIRLITHLWDQELPITLPVSAEVIHDGFQIRTTQFTYLRYLLWDRLQQTAGDDDISPTLQLGFDLHHNILVTYRLLRQQYDLLVFCKRGIHIHR